MMSKIHPEDFFIGGLFLYKGGGVEIPIEVMEILSDGVKCCELGCTETSSVFLYFEEIHPLPITGEILEALGLTMIWKPNEIGECIYLYPVLRNRGLEVQCHCMINGYYSAAAQIKTDLYTSKKFGSLIVSVHVLQNRIYGLSGKKVLYREGRDPQNMYFNRVVFHLNNDEFIYDRDSFYVSRVSDGKLHLQKTINGELAHRTILSTDIETIKLLTYPK